MPGEDVSVTTQVDSTAIIKVNPSTDSAFVALSIEVGSLLKYAYARTITTAEDVKAAAEDLALISKLRKAIEEKRKEYTNPLNEHLKAINDTFKTLSTPLDEADTVTRKAIIAYRQEQDRHAREVAEIERLKNEAAAREAKLAGAPPPPVVVEPAAPAASTKVHATGGTLATSTVWKFEVVDFKQLPDEYKIADSVKLGKVVRAGLRNIPGVRIWSEDSLKMTTSK